MNNVAYLNGVSPGPACVIPEEKKIFRVIVGDEPASTLLSYDSGEAGDAAPLPVPHMYSA